MKVRRYKLSQRRARCVNRPVHVKQEQMIATDEIETDTTGS